MVWGKVVVDLHTVGNPVSGIHYHAGGITRGIQGQNPLNGSIHSWGVEGLKQDLKG